MAVNLPARLRLKRYPINMVLFGPPGVGKSVYCNLLEKDLGLKTFSTGEFSRLLNPENLSHNSSFTKQQRIEI